MALFSLFVGVLLVVLSLLFWLDKAPKRLINFDKIQKEEGGTLRIKALRRNISIVLILLAVPFVLTGLSAQFKEKYFLISIIVWVALVFLDIFWIGKSNYYRQ